MLQYPQWSGLKDTETSSLCFIGILLGSSKNKDQSFLFVCICVLWSEGRNKV